MFIPIGVPMIRRTISIPAATEGLVLEHAREGESFSAAIARLAEAGARAQGRRRVPAYVGAYDGDSSPGDLGRRADYYLRNPVAAR